MSDREADLDIPQKLWSAWAPAIGSRAIVRAMTDSERWAVTRRCNELQAGLQPLGKEGSEDRELADGVLSAMIDGFRSMRLAPDQLRVRVNLLLMLLAEFPGWAIARGCQKIMTNKAGLRPEFAPNDAEIYAVVEKEVKPFKPLLQRAEALLAAPIEPPPEIIYEPDPTPEQRAMQTRLLDTAAKLSRVRNGDAPWDSKMDHGDKKSVQPGYMQRVLADIEARKKARESA